MSATGTASVTSLNFQGFEEERNEPNPLQSDLHCPRPANNSW